MLPTNHDDSVAQELVIATVLPDHGGCGVQTHFQSIAERALEAGVRVHIATPYAANVWARRAGNVVGRVLRPLSREAATLWSKASLAHLLEDQLRAMLRGGTSRRVTVYAQDPRSAEAALRVRRRTSDFRIAAVVHYNGSEAEECAMNNLTKPGGRLWRALLEREARVLPAVDQLLFVSNFMRGIVERRVPEIRRVPTAVIPNFPRRAVPAAAPARGSGDVITIGTLEERKNHAFLVRVVAAAAALGYRYRLTIVGAGPLRSELERLATELRVRSQISFLGYVKDAAVLMPEHRVYAHAAVAENFPIVLLEAMQHGIPLLAPAVGGIPEVFDDGVEGRYWPLEDPARAAAVLVETLESERHRSAMALAARSRYERSYSPDVLSGRWLDGICGRGWQSLPSRRRGA